jgi:hypothetical protein
MELATQKCCIKKLIVECFKVFEFKGLKNPGSGKNLQTGDTVSHVGIFDPSCELLPL